MEIEMVSLAVMVEGKPFLVALSQDRLEMLLQVSGSLAGGGGFSLVAAPEGFTFTTLGVAGQMGG